MATSKAVAIKEAEAVKRLVSVFGDDIRTNSKDADMARAMQLEAIADKVEAMAEHASLLDATNATLEEANTEMAARADALDADNAELRHAVEEMAARLKGLEPPAPEVADEDGAPEAAEDLAAQLPAESSVKPSKAKSK